MRVWTSTGCGGFTITGALQGGLRADLTDEGSTLIVRDPSRLCETRFGPIPEIVGIWQVRSDGSTVWNSIDPEPIGSRPAARRIVLAIRLAIASRLGAVA